MLKIKRAYEKQEPQDGKRILIDRLWPRGLSRERAGIDEWMKDLAPSTELRTWYGHDAAKWPEFRRRNIEELSSPERTSILEDIARTARQENITLVYSARDTEHSDARVLEELIGELMAKVNI
ncbi:MAG: DUF488 family protein [Chloroflexi bacterium]|nr:DUF488 family protein [Chloroflexota bacterium]